MKKIKAIAIVSFVVLSLLMSMLPFASAQTDSLVVWEKILRRKSKQIRSW